MPTTMLLLMTTLDLTSMLERTVMDMLPLDLTLLLFLMADARLLPTRLMMPTVDMLLMSSTKEPPPIMLLLPTRLLLLLSTRLLQFLPTTPKYIQKTDLNYLLNKLYL